MKWHNHKITTASMVFAATGTFVSASLAAIGSVLPDLLEARGVLRHRTYTHWPYPYVLAGALMYWSLIYEPTYPLYCMFFVVVGSICHLFEDQLDKYGIPFGSPTGKRRGFDFYVTGTQQEYLTVSVLLAAAWLVIITRGFGTTEYLRGEAQHLIDFLGGIVKLIMRG